ncbi:MAG: GNAT family N-acetyltransferase [Nitrospirae bacterium]|nr:GNAT family N-acetyltransferase [Nitrospirota bacterium]
MTIKINRPETTPSAGTVSVEPLPGLKRYSPDHGSALKWDCLFMLPPWIGPWWSYFGEGSQTRLYVVKQSDEVLGVAPLAVTGDTARLISDSNLIDYSDFIVAHSREMEFFSILFDHLRREGVSRLQTGRVRADSTAFSCLHAYSTPLGCDVSSNPVDVLYEIDLSDTWEGYLGILSAKERHETRRKFRRLESAGRVGLRVIEDKKDVLHAMDTFISLFRSNSTEKALFMAGDVESFFRSLAVEMADAGLLMLLFLDLNDRPVAATMCFDYRSTVYLYNNGYDRDFGHLSVGLLSKVLSIQESIKRGRKKYNLLRGSEAYKGRVGGRPVRLFHCEAILK